MKALNRHAGYCLRGLAFIAAVWLGWLLAATTYESAAFREILMLFGGVMLAAWGVGRIIARIWK